MYEGQQIYSEIAAEGKLYYEKAVNDALHLYPVPPHHVWYVETGRQIPLETPSQFFLEQGIGAEKFNLYGVPEDKQDLFTKTLSGMDFVSFMDGTPKDVQCICTRLDKVEAVGTLLSHLGIGFENIMSLGDSVGMDGLIIERAGLGVAMGNAPDALKEKAAYVTAPSHENGVALAIEKFLL
jgi:hydroxymethylpyrimidine pyrophosphatase-like HAD family hydrolase